MLLLLRFARDRAVSSSIEAGANTLQHRFATTPARIYGFAPAAAEILPGTGEQQVRALIDDNFLHLDTGQRDEVFASLQKILQDPQHEQEKSRIVLEFAQKAREVRECYTTLARLSRAEKKNLAALVGEEYRHMPESERLHLFDVLNAGSLPLPRDLRDIMLAELRAG